MNIEIEIEEVDFCCTSEILIFPCFSYSEKDNLYTDLLKEFEEALYLCRNIGILLTQTPFPLKDIKYKENFDIFIKKQGFEEYSKTDSGIVLYKYIVGKEGK